MLTDKEKEIISQIACDYNSGRDLLRTIDGWKQLPFTKEEYVKYAEIINNVANTMNWWILFDSKYIEHLEVLIYFAGCVNYDFDQILREYVEETK